MDAPDPTRPDAEPVGSGNRAAPDALSVPPVPTTWLDPVRASRLAGQASAAAAEVGDQLTLPMDPSAAAFFDVDNTLMRGASLFHLARGLAMRRYFTVREVSDFAMKQARFVLSGSEDMDDVASVTESGLAFVKGRSVEEVTTLGEEIFDELMTRKLWPGTLVLAQRHLDRGQRVWLVTATPVELARMIARRLGLTGALGTVAEVRDGIYTGRLVGAPLHGKAKAAAVTALAEREALDLTRCAAYSDSANDVPMLSLVGRPVAVNPDSTLRRHARAVGWEIHDYRRARFRRRFAIPVAVAAIAGAGVGAGLGIAAVQSKNRP